MQNFDYPESFPISNKGSVSVVGQNLKLYVETLGDLEKEIAAIDTPHGPRSAGMEKSSSTVITFLTWDKVTAAAIEKWYDDTLAGKQGQLWKMTFTFANQSDTPAYKVTLTALCQRIKTPGYDRSSVDGRPLKMEVTIGFQGWKKDYL